MDYRTKLSKGCGFVTFAARQEAENAMKVCGLPARARRPAGPNIAAAMQCRAAMLLAAKGATYRRTVYWLHSRQYPMGRGKNRRDGSALPSHAQPFQPPPPSPFPALPRQALDQTYTMPGSRMVLSVRWADPDLQERKRRAAEGLSEDDRQVSAVVEQQQQEEEDEQRQELGARAVAGGARAEGKECGSSCGQQRRQQQQEQSSSSGSCRRWLLAGATRWAQLSCGGWTCMGQGCTFRTGSPVHRAPLRPPAQGRLAPAHSTLPPAPFAAQLFVAKVLKSSPPEDVQQLFSHYGTVEKVSMFKPAPDAIYHKVRWARCAGRKLGQGRAGGHSQMACRCFHLTAPLVCLS